MAMTRQVKVFILHSFLASRHLADMISDRAQIAFKIRRRAARLYRATDEAKRGLMLAAFWNVGVPCAGEDCLENKVHGLVYHRMAFLLVFIDLWTKLPRGHQLFDLLRPDLQAQPGTDMWRLTWCSPRHILADLRTARLGIYRRTLFEL